MYVNELKETFYEKSKTTKKYLDASKEIVFSLSGTEHHSFIPFYVTYSKNILHKAHQIVSVDYVKDIVKDTP